MTKRSSGRAITEETEELLRTHKPENANQIILLNLPFVANIAKQYLPQAGATGQQLADLKQEGVFGLYDALERFDPNRGIKFTTYAGWWIRARVTRLIHKNSGPFGGGLHSRQLERRKILKHATKEFCEAHGREPTHEELFPLTGLSRNAFEQTLIEQSVRTHSLEAKNKDGDPWRDAVASPRGQDPESNINKDAAHKKASRLTEEMVDYLRGMERKRNVNCFVARFRLDGREDVPTLEQLGEEHGISKERVRQILEKCLKLLRRRYQYDLEEMTDLLNTLSGP